MVPNDYERVVKHQREEQQRPQELERHKDIRRKRGVKTGMKPAGFQDDLTQIPVEMKIMNKSSGKEVWE